MTDRKPFIATYPHGWDPLGRGHTAASLHEQAMPVVEATAIEPTANLIGSDRPEVAGTPAPVPESGADDLAPTPWVLPASGPVRPVDVRNDPTDEVVVAIFDVGEPVQILGRDRTRRRALIAAPVAVFVSGRRPADRSAAGFPVGTTPVELTTWAELWAWTTAGEVTVSVLVEYDRDERRPS